MPFNTLPTMMSPKTLPAQDKAKLLKLEEEMLLLELERRNRAQNREVMPQIINHEQRLNAYVAAYPFTDFVKESFPICEPSRKFENNWHIDIICQILEGTITGSVKNFLINQPRRTMKSLLSCVMFNAWVWTFLPHLRFLYTSYKQQFTERDTRKTSLLVNSEWYQTKFGNSFRLLKDNKNQLSLSKGGFRIGFRIGKGVGEGGDFVFADDPNDIEEVESEIVLEKTNRGWDETSSQNVQDRRTVVRAVIQQRTAPNDLTGHILEKYPELFKTHLCVPNRFEEDHPHISNVERPLSLGFVNEYDVLKNTKLKFGEPKLWIDPRNRDADKFENAWYQDWYETHFASKGLKSKGEGQLLWESYIDEKVTVESEKFFGVYGTSAQLQQRPIRRGGNFFGIDKFQEIDFESINLNDLIYIRYWDKAGTEGAGDWTVGTLIARTKKRPFKFYILDMVRGQFSYFKRMQMMKETAKQDFENYVMSKNNTSYTIGLEQEGSSSGKDLSAIEKDEFVGFNVWIDTKKVGKESRAQIVRGLSEQGVIYIVKDTLWFKVLFQRLQKYDPRRKRAKDDEIDTLGGGCYYLSFLAQGEAWGSSSRFL